MSACFCSFSYATPIPNAADASKIKPEEKITPEDHSQDDQVTTPAPPPAVAAPPGADRIKLVLEHVVIEGATAFTPEQLADTYTPYLNKDETLDIAWVIAGAITERYRNAGYFLSRAYVPVQHIKDNTLTIKVVEGYIGNVVLDDPAAEHYAVKSLIADLLNDKPVTSNEVESFLLRLNDLPGLSFRAVMSPSGVADDQAVKMTLIPTAKEFRGSVSFDNFGSRFLGPNEVSTTLQGSLLPLQQTTLSGLSSTPDKELKYGVIDQNIVLTPDFSLDINGGQTRAYPGYTLQSEDIKSLVNSASVTLNYQWIRQRQENLTLNGGMYARNFSNDILYTSITRDRIRALFTGFSYDANDPWKGYDTANFTVTRGIKLLGISEKDDLDLSRQYALPDFTKGVLNLSRLQPITDHWSLMAKTSGQISSGTLYSSEEFGYGGQDFGRAYDTSQITGDSGLNGSLELRYSGLNTGDFVTFQPFTFYDIGTIWNDSVGQPPRESGASVGFGTRFSTSLHQSGIVGVAYPLTRDITIPIYGDKNDYRIFLQLTQEY